MTFRSQYGDTYVIESAPMIHTFRYGVTCHDGGKMHARTIDAFTPYHQHVLTMLDDTIVNIVEYAWDERNKPS